MNMFKGSKATTVEEYLNNVPLERQEIINYLHQFIQDAVPNLEPYFAFNMIGYGKFHYKDYKKRYAEWPIIALANQKNYVSVYVCAVKDGEYIAEQYKESLGKVSVGKSCIRFNKLEKINLDVLKEVLELAAENPGLVYAGEHKS